MSTATASVADVRLENKEDSRSRNDPGRPQAQCTLRPMPAVGTQRIIQGNGTNVGTVISLQCPARHKLVGKDLICVMGTNSTQWVGETFCQPLLPYEDYGFRVAVLASIISSGIILLMSVAFITCCLLECTEEDKNKKEERDSNGPHWEGQDQRQEDSRSGYSHKGRNNNNNNAEEKVLPWWETANPALCDNIRPCRCQQPYNHGRPLPPLAALPGQDYDQPLLPQNLPTCPPEYPGPPLSSCQAANSGVVHFSAAGCNPPLSCHGGQSGRGMVQGSRDRLSGDFKVNPTCRLFGMARLTIKDTEGYDEQLQSDAQFLCSHQRMDTELVDRLVLQLNRIYPQILSDKEACKFRSLRVPIKLRLSELLMCLHGKGDNACYEFYRALHIHAEDVYFSLPSRIRQREMPDSGSTISVAVIPDRCVLNDRGPMFFLSCFSFVVGIAVLYYYGEGQRLRCTEAFLHCSAVRLSKDAKDIFISYVEVGKQK